MERDEPIATGRTAGVFAWGDGRVLKVFRAGMPAGMAAFEAHAARVAEAAGLPVPRGRRRVSSRSAKPPWRS